MTKINMDDLTADDLLKGMPGDSSVRLSDIADRNWNVLNEDLPLPLAVLKQRTVDENSTWMRRFLALSGARLAPHGKTTMSPQLFHKQLQDGAWGITLANIAQVQVARRFGISRIVLANQLVGKQALRYVFTHLRDDSDFDFYCLVDSIEGVAILAEAARHYSIGRPLQVLLEGGVLNRRTGVRDLQTAMDVARAVHATDGHLALRGVEGFEGVISAPSPRETETRITAFLRFLGEIAKQAVSENLFADGDIILSAGGSAFYDLVVDEFTAVELGRAKRIVVRSGCYLTHDSIMYEKMLANLLARSPEARELGAPPRPALEVWAYVQSRPEPERVIFTLGKRDAGFDAGFPLPQLWHRPGRSGGPHAVPPGHVTIEMNDQHLFMNVPETSPLQVGDMVGFGISHPCLTFDRWQFIPMVDDDYRVVSAIRTYF